MYTLALHKFLRLFIAQYPCSYPAPHICVVDLSALVGSKGCSYLCPLDLFACHAHRQACAWCLHWCSVLVSRARAFLRFVPRWLLLRFRSPSLGLRRGSLRVPWRLRSSGGSAFRSVRLCLLVASACPAWLFCLRCLIPASPASAGGSFGCSLSGVPDDTQHHHAQRFLHL